MNYPRNNQSKDSPEMSLEEKDRAWNVAEKIVCEFMEKTNL